MPTPGSESDVPTKPGKTKPDTADARLLPLRAPDSALRALVRSRPRRRRLAWTLGAPAAVLGALAVLAVYEAWTSRFQARFFARAAREAFWETLPGPSDRIRFPAGGPSDERRGYARLPAFTEALAAKGFKVESQARFSDPMLALADRGIYPPYEDKTQAGLRLLDAEGRALFASSYPLRVYPSFDSIPAEIANTLLFIENRSLLDARRPFRNPGVEWSRLGRAAADLAGRKLGREGNVAGGSTLATQMEKYKHSGDGLTQGPEQKALQMLSASLRAYRGGERTLEARKRILLEYVNTVPLAALPGYGEVNGLYDGLLAWYGASLDSVNRQLRSPRSRGAENGGVDPGLDMAARGRAYRQVLNLFIAHRRPSAYLLQDRDGLKAIGDRYLRLLEREGIISPQLRDAALEADPPLMRRAAAFFPAAQAERKHVNAVRARLTGTLGLPRLYDLDRLDLAVGTTLDGKTQKAVAQLLKRLADPAFVDSAGLRSFRLLEKGDPSRVVYSFTLYESSGGRNLLRVQADNYEQPLNINEGVKLDLGSTAKLRTLVHYLEVVAAVRARLAGRPAPDLQALAAAGPDPLTRWTAGLMASAPDTSLGAVMEAAMERRYSGDPRERFFTGGGLHSFANFERSDDGVFTVREALRNSVNLVFIRMMRDIVQHHIAQGPASQAALLDADLSPERRRYLARFAEQEGQLYLGRFYRKYRDKGPSEIREAFFHGVRPVPRRLASAYLAVDPGAGLPGLSRFLRAALNDSLYPQHLIDQAYARHFQDSLGLADLGYLAGVHPLELWLVGHLLRHPGDSWSRVKEAGRAQVQETYQWLFKTRHRPAQDRRIRSIMEMEAFLEVHRAWARLGYPFGSLVPSYATAIGSSADRPNALAELVGIILNDGVRHQPVLIDRLLFAEGTPYQTQFAFADTAGRRLLPPELCRAVKSALLDVVDNGTAARGRRAFPAPGGGFLPLGGKTGTGDQRFETYGPGGRLLESRAVNRTATFVFFLGDRFFGTLTAHVRGEQAAQYGFTSSLPVQVLRLMAPALTPLLAAKQEPIGPDGAAPAVRRAESPALHVAGAFLPPRLPAAPHYAPIARAQPKKPEARARAHGYRLKPWYESPVPGAMRR